ncbi:MAG: hypothetical protein V4501_08120 [Pseudomonadota bacterium]
MRHGEATRVLAEINRNRKERPEPYKAQDFIFWGIRSDAKAANDAAEPVLISDKKAQSDLIRAHIFGIQPSKKGR